MSQSITIIAVSPSAAIECEPRQVWKEAAAAFKSGAGMWLTLNFMSEILANQWRPQSFDEVLGQSTIVKALTNALDQSLLHHCYLFSGTRGVGKHLWLDYLPKG